MKRNLLVRLARAPAPSAGTEVPPDAPGRAAGRLRCPVLIALLAFVSCAGAAERQLPTVGIEGHAEAVLPSRDYVPRPVDDRTDLILRIDAIQPVEGGGFRYTFHYLGLEPGAFALSEHLVRSEGEPAAELSNTQLQVGSLLPKDHDGSLADAPRRRLPWLGGYRAGLVLLGLLWAAVLVVLARMNRPLPTPPAPPPAPPPSLADLLRPLAEAAAAGGLDAAGRARLERLMIRYWSDRLALTDLPATELLPRLRLHPEGGLLLRAVEEWLHSPRGASPEDVRRVLRPYAGAAAPAAREEAG